MIHQRIQNEIDRHGTDKFFHTTNHSNKCKHDKQLGFYTLNVSMLCILHILCLNNVRIHLIIIHVLMFNIKEERDRVRVCVRFT